MSATKNTFKGMIQWSLLVSVAFAALLSLAQTDAALAAISLGTAESFGVLGGSTVTNTGATIITGNLGVSPGSAVTGFPPGTVTPPSTIHKADAIAAQARIDVTTAYNAIIATPTLVDLTGTDLGGLTLTPGVYGFNSSAQLTGTLILDALGNPNAVFIFKIGSSLTTASGSSVLMINGGSSCNVFWQVGSSATLGTTTTFEGNILALSSITLTTSASVSGRALARNGAVTLDGNSVTGCSALSPIICPNITLIPTTLPSGAFGTLYSQTVSASGGTAPYTFASAPLVPVPGLTLTSAGLLSGTPTTAGTFNFTITATDANGCSGIQLYSIVIASPGCPPITLIPIPLPVGAVGIPYSQTVSASGGTAPYTFASAPLVPVPGLTLTSAGLLSGTPTTVGIFNFTITAMDANGCLGSLAYSISIASCLIPTLGPPTLPDGVVGTPYSQTVSASGGTAPYTYAYSGTLPNGLSLNTGTGAITGTPTANGVFSFIITATDANDCKVLLGYTVTIAIPGGNVPALSEWGMIIFMFLLGLITIYYLRRQKAKV